jgi:hypothetical protein
LPQGCARCPHSRISHCKQRRRLLRYVPSVDTLLYGTLLRSGSLPSLLRGVRYLQAGRQCWSLSSLGRSCSRRWYEKRKGPLQPWDADRASSQSIFLSDAARHEDRATSLTISSSRKSSSRRWPSCPSTSCPSTSCPSTSCLLYFCAKRLSIIREFKNETWSQVKNGPTWVSASESQTEPNHRTEAIEPKYAGFLLVMTMLMGPEAEEPNSTSFGRRFSTREQVK